MQKGNGFRIRARSVFRRIFHVLSAGWEFDASENIHFLGHFCRSQRLSLILARIVGNSLLL